MCTLRAPIGVSYIVLDIFQLGQVSTKVELHITLTHKSNDQYQTFEEDNVFS